MTIKNWRLGYAPNDFHYLENFLAKFYPKRDIAEAGLIIKREEGSVKGEDSSFAKASAFVKTSADKSADKYFDRFRDRVMFPIQNLHGQIVGFTGRMLHESDKAGKYINSPETPIYNKSQVIYGLYQAKIDIRKENRAIFVEGNLDVISSHQAGFNEAVASSGTALTEQHLLAIKRFTDNLIFAFDSDAAGSEASKRALELALTLGFNVRMVDMGGAKDPDELIKKGIGLWKKAVDSAENYLEYFFKATFERFDLNSVEDKREITKQLAPLIARVSEPITKAHFIRKLSNGINVSEQVIWDLVNKVKNPKSSHPRAQQEKRGKIEVLEDELLGLSAFLKTNEAIIDFEVKDFKPENQPVFTYLISNSKVNSETSERLKLLIFFIENLMSEEKLDAKEELARAVKEFKKIKFKKRMEEISNEIAAAEKKKDHDMINKLSLEFTRLSNQINEIT